MTAESVTLDLDAIKAADREAAGEGPTVRIAGKVYQLPAKLPLAVAVAVTENDMRTVVEVLFGTQAAADVLPHLTVDDLDPIANLYGTTAGE